MFGNIYKNCRVLVTGNTGFKGSWLGLWLMDLGAEVFGFSLDVPTEPSHHAILNPEYETLFGDIRDLATLERAVAYVRPNIVFHMAAQSLVRRSYTNPVETFATNIMGTVNLLDVCRRPESSVKAVVIVTSDKCYENREHNRPYQEDDSLGGHDPYSASKACAELVAAAYRRSFFDPAPSPLMATVRAGNVIGGGDWGDDRLIPDIIRSITSETTMIVRYPQATRPWQHVLDPLSGYLLLGYRLLAGHQDCASCWNFGPDAREECSVISVLETMKDYLKFNWTRESQPQPYEAAQLRLNCDKAINQIAWRPLLSFEQAVAMTADWYRAWLEQQQALSSDQLAEYIRLAREQRTAWVDDE